MGYLSGKEEKAENSRTANSTAFIVYAWISFYEVCALLSGLIYSISARGNFSPFSTFCALLHSIDTSSALKFRNDCIKAKNSSLVIETTCAWEF